MIPLATRLARRLLLDPASGCLLWTGALDTHGYGVIRDGVRVRKVHRVAWELENGPIPEGLTIDHVLARGCVHLNCANIAHLDAVTTAENSYRSPRYNGNKTHCLRGHPFSDDNTVFYRGSRFCLVCRRLRRKAADIRTTDTPP